MPHAHPSGFPSPCNDRGGQAPALREKTGPFLSLAMRLALSDRITFVGQARLILTRL